MQITPDQIRAARALKNWSQGQLAKMCQLTTATIANIELGKQKPSSETVQKIYAAFIRNGILFTDNDGVQRQSGFIQAYSGQSGFLEFFEHVDQTASSNPGTEFLIAHVREQDFIRWQGGKPLPSHVKAIRKANVNYRILICEDDDYMPAAEYAEYRQVPKSLFFSVPYYVFGENVGIISFEQDTVNIFVIQHAPIVDLYRKQFEEMWARSQAIERA